MKTNSCCRRKDKSENSFFWKKRQKAKFMNNLNFVNRTFMSSSFSLAFLLRAILRIDWKYLKIKIRRKTEMKSKMHFNCDAKWSRNGTNVASSLEFTCTSSLCWQSIIFNYFMLSITIDGETSDTKTNLKRADINRFDEMFNWTNFVSSRTTNSLGSQTERANRLVMR